MGKMQVVKMNLICLVVAAGVVTVASDDVAANDNWPNWRGPDQTGVAPGDAYPTKWSAEDHVAWKYEIPGRGASTPIVWDDSIILTSGSDGKDSVMCLDRTGKQQWQVDLSDEVAGRHRKGSGSNPSAVTDGNHVFVYFKSGTLACLDFAGKIQWQKDLNDYAEDNLWWDLGTSPVLTQDYLVVTRIQNGPSYVIAFDKASGKEVWKHLRDVPAPRESAQSYTTPVVCEYEGQEIIAVLGADHVTAHDAATGERIWIVGGLNPEGHEMFRSISSPVYATGYLVAPYARGDTLTCIQFGGRGDVTDTHVAWISDRSADVPTPAIFEGHVYVLSDRGRISVLDLETGEEVQSLELPRSRTTYSSSPVIAAGHLYATNERGVTHVVKLGDDMERVATNALDEQTVATPVLLDGRIYLRTYDHLYCIE